MTIDKIWLAGFIDGEGCLRFARCRNSIFPQIWITNTNQKVLLLIQAKYGGDITSQKLKDNWKRGYQYRTSWKTAMTLLDDVYDHLLVKKDQADLIYEWKKIRLGRGTKSLKAIEAYRCKVKVLTDRMTSLNKKGD